MKNKILIIENEENISNIIAFNLKKEGYEVEQAFDGKEGLEKFFVNDFQLILLDIMMPELDGYQVCKEVRKESNIPIIMLTAKSEEIDTILGLELGADDYISKPFKMKELKARVKAKIRRSQDFKEIEENNFYTKRISIDFKKYEVYKDNQLIDLTINEFNLLKHLTTNKGKIMTRDNILENVWGTSDFIDERVVDVSIRRLREKIEDNPSKPEYILTKRGIGYYFK